MAIRPNSVRVVRVTAVLRRRLASKWRHHIERSGERVEFDWFDERVLLWVALLRNEIVGHVSCKIEEVDWADCGELQRFEEKPDAVQSRDLNVTEAFVQSFAVDPAYRRLGVGRRLQTAMVRACKKQGVSQLRSWSSCDAVENYRLKLSMGFCVVPSYYFVPRANKWSRGAYFVMKLR
ncbi:GNAT family N-acetyltransferase [Fimbriimonadia bacterium ATM]|nr:MAG: GNAT family N-acetyltransferase [Armatimonadota bacterium]MBC6970166.1 GNAT family N-acetyltransferase [Armatimonadota bacterium]MCE7900569.1 GNAT family N-acetyltransferase [Armatimonadetes bacterium ATM1]MDL1929342.1 GNAT family N-acetyltransferase [Fimbriimonadia bacterium ATM]RIJ97115.1 MAG: hypothetical protein DCC45_03495 [Armatimonadota bacterium]